MKEYFRSYYPTDDEWLNSIWEEALFVLDASALLAPYRWEPQTRQDYLSALEELQDRIWIPHQAALEYHRNRLRQIQATRNSYKETINSLKKIREDLDKYVRSYSHNLREEESALQASIQELIGVLQTGVQKAEGEHKKTFGAREDVEEDNILDRFTSLFDGCVGPPYPPDDFIAHCQAADQRYSLRIPPGYEDIQKPAPERYGDYLIWAQILDHARQEQRSIILVINDTKEDWFVVRRGQAVDAREELRNELREIAGVDLTLYTAHHLVNEAKERLGLEISDASIEEMEVRTEPKRDLLNWLGLRESSEENARRLRQLQMLSLRPYESEGQLSIFDLLPGAVPSAGAISPWPNQFQQARERGEIAPYLNPNVGSWSEGFNDPMGQAANLEDEDTNDSDGDE